MLTSTKGFDSRSRCYDDSWQLPKYSLLMEVYLETLLHPGLIEQLQAPNFLKFVL
jgi:hypothetical protein